jgi:hypothetical protein
MSPSHFVVVDYDLFGCESSRVQSNKLPSFFPAVVVVFDCVFLLLIRRFVVLVSRFRFVLVTL